MLLSSYATGSGKHHNQKTKKKRSTYKNALVVLFYSSGCRLKQINGRLFILRKTFFCYYALRQLVLDNSRNPPFDIPTGYSYMIKTIGLKKHTRSGCFSYGKKKTHTQDVLGPIYY
jgi:hypothetical protein